MTLFWLILPPCALESYSGSFTKRLYKDSGCQQQRGSSSAPSAFWRRLPSPLAPESAYKRWLSHFFGKVSVFWTNVIANTIQKTLKAFFIWKYCNFPIQMMQICFSIGRWWRVAFELIKFTSKAFLESKINKCLLSSSLVAFRMVRIHASVQKNVRWFSSFVSFLNTLYYLTKPIKDYVHTLTIGKKSRFCNSHLSCVRQPLRSLSGDCSLRSQ